LNGFFCYTPQGADYNTCPLCGTSSDECKLNYDDYPSFSDGGDVCDKCKIIYDVGCTHACNGCTDDCYNGHLVGKWKHIPSNQIYTGMPQFDSTEECKVELHNIIILEWICPNNGMHCTKGFYPKSNNPQYYHTCKLTRLV
jgi:hypothetical protein